MELSVRSFKAVLLEDGLKVKQLRIITKSFCFILKCYFFTFLKFPLRV